MTKQSKDPRERQARKSGWRSSGVARFRRERSCFCSRHADWLADVCGAGVFQYPR